MQLSVYSGFCLKHSWELHQLLQNNNVVEIVVESLFRKWENGSIAPLSPGEKVLQPHFSFSMGRLSL